MTTINLYVHKDYRSQTTKVWESFFQQFLPQWDLSFRSAEDVLRGNPQHILFPGGSGSAFAKRLGFWKRSDICEWVAAGGSYIGVCAGAYLAVSHLGITPLIISDPAWERGLHDVIIESTSPLSPLHQTVNYHNGPIFDEDSSVDVWARFKSDHLAEGGSKRMEGTPAICHNTYGEGLVTLYSPHLEKSSDASKSDLANSFEYIDKLAKQNLRKT